MSNLSKNEFDYFSASERMVFYLSILIFHNNPNMNQLYFSQSDQMNALLKFYEENEEYEKCNWINEIIKKHILKKHFEEPQIDNRENHNDYYQWLFKSTVLSIIYYDVICFDDRFYYFKSESEIDDLIQYFESIDELDKCLVLMDIKEHYSFEVIKKMLNIIFNNQF